MRRKRKPLPSVSPHLIPQGLQGEAEKQLKIALAKFADAVYLEAQRLEAVQTVAGGAQEITGGMVAKAAEKVRDPFGQPPQTGFDVFLYVAGVVSALGVGILGNQLDKTWAAIVCILLAPVAVGCGVYSYMRGGQ